MLGGLTSELDKIAPSFDIDSSQLQILTAPAEFYETLKAKISNANRRIYISTLYIGKTENELIATIGAALRKNEKLEVSFLTDALRGTREAPEPCCASLLAPLIAEFGAKRVEVRMFHTPNLVGIRKRLIPKRINEGWGLQHIKLYGIDDELIISGANLSTDYFTNRQDRYHVFSCKNISDYFHQIHKAICNISYKVQPNKDDPAGFRLKWPSGNATCTPLSDPERFRAESSRLLEPLMTSRADSTHKSRASDTVVYPLLQMTPLMRRDISTELPALRIISKFLSSSECARSKWTFTAGYFNMTPEVRQMLLDTRPAQGTVIAASPWANGFYGSKGVSGLLPPAYTLLSRRFLDAVSAAGLSKQITLKEWRRGTVNEPGGWTYHAKGLWVTLPDEDKPTMSLVGSSNYTKRSHSLDLEANVLILTRNEDLMKRLRDEEQYLQEYAHPVGYDEYLRTERRVGLHVRVALWIVKLLGGAL